MSNAAAFDNLLRDKPVIAVLRGLGVEATLDAVRRVRELGILAVEVTVQSPLDIEALAATVDEARGSEVVVGAGTVLTRADAEMAANAGATFAVSPGFSEEISEATREFDLPWLPGVATATEIHAAQRQGYQWMKAFPAESLGVGWFKAVAGPFPDIRLVATGGVRPQTASTFLRAGARAVGIGTALDNADGLEALRYLVVEFGDPSTRRIHSEPSVRSGVT